MSWSSYPKIWNLGHKAVAGLFLKSVLVEEKVDGSQFSFGRFGGELRVRSKGRQFDPDSADKLFSSAVAHVAGLDLRDGYTYRGEVLSKPKHNVLAYGRVPVGNVIIFDINDGLESYLPYEAKVEEASRLGLEVVPKLFEGVVEDVGVFRELLQNTSCLGGAKIEGVVIKRYDLFGEDKKATFGKFVSEEFKETHRKEWKSDQKPQVDILTEIGEELRTPARWRKAVGSMRDAGELQDSPRDIAKLIEYVGLDVLSEEKDYIKDKLFDWAWKRLRPMTFRGLPEWYKQKLLDKQFGEDEEKLFFVQKQEDGSAVTYDGFGGVSQTVHGDSQAEQGGSG